MQHRTAILIALAALTLGACEEVVPNDVPRTSLPDDEGVAPGDPFALELPPSSAVMHDRFATSRECALCHSNHQSATAMRDAAGNEIAPFNLWQGTMMANAARDPLWRAVMSAEIAATPAAKGVIEEKCMRCHAPMASEAQRAVLNEARLHLLTDTTTPVNALALDGVSCTVCHQIDPANLGSDESFSGGFVIGNQRRIYGPHENPVTGPMQVHVNYTPTYASHVTQSELCATCHTVFTHALTEEGDDAGAQPFPEQTAYLEWQNSIYGNPGLGDEARACQSCHMPTVDELGNEIETRIARSPPGGDFLINERKPFGRHLFVGANTLMPAIFKDMRAVLNPQATDEAFDATIALARMRLEDQTAVVEISDVSEGEGSLAFAVQVHNEVGHKFPTGFPARRAWLHVTVTDASGAVLFESGASDARGRILAQGGALLDVEKAAGGFEPHHDVITRDDQVQIYEAVMGDTGGARTPLLLRAERHLKDNRLLPLGFSAEFADYDSIKPRGQAAEDATFVAGQDTVRFELDLEGAPARVDVELVYQTLGSRFAMDLFQTPTDEIAAFRYMWKRADVTPVLVATASQEL